MKYPKLLQKGDIIGVCAPSSGISGEKLNERMDNAIFNIKEMGYDVLETESVRSSEKCVSADSATRAAEFMSLYENSQVSAILPPWGGEFLMDILPYLDIDILKKTSPKWVCGYSDISTLTFVLTVACDIASLHGSNLMNMGFSGVHETDLRMFESISKPVTEQQSWDKWGGFTSWVDFSQEVYKLDKPSLWKALKGEERISIDGMMVGGCMDTLCKLIGTRFAPVETFLNKYRKYGFIWTLESCEMNSADIYRTLWQMRECGWFEYCKGIIGRPDGYRDVQDFTLPDALQQGVGNLNVPVIYDADIGHIPPQMQIVNGAIGHVEFINGRVRVKQVQLDTICETP